MSEKVTKKSVNYRVSTNPKEKCGTCSMYRAGGMCTYVQGKIYVDDVCNEWDTK